MKIRIQRTGGFAGLRRETSIEDAEQYRAQIEQSGFFNLPVEIPSARSEADRFQYRITVEDGKRIHTVISSESALPPALLDLCRTIFSA